MIIKWHSANYIFHYNVILIAIMKLQRRIYTRYF